MNDVARLLLLSFLINSIRIASFVSMEALSENDIIIDIIKGYALRRTGVYSPHTVHDIIHTFVPIDNLCVASPEDAVCLYASLPVKTNVVELGTMMAPRQTVHTLSSYDSDTVSKLINKDMNQVLIQHHPDEIMKEAKAAIYFINKQFHYNKIQENQLTAASTTNVIDNYSDIPRLHPTAVEVIRNQMNNNKIGFDYLSQPDLTFFLSTIFSTIDNTHSSKNVKESLNIFLQSIVGQSVFALRHCSLNAQNSLLSRPCLAISTLFLRVPADAATRFLIYRLIPLPIVSNGDKYIYSNLPKIVGINPINQMLITWNDESDVNQCIFSSLVQCEKMPVTIPLSKSLCLSELFNDNELSTNMCKISRSQHIDEDVIDIENGIWLFHNVRQTEYCQIYSTSKDFSETLSISEPAILRIPCDKTITCVDMQLPPSSCTQRRTIIKSNAAFNFTNLLSFIAPIRNMTETIVSSYQKQSRRSMKELLTVFALKESNFKMIFDDILLYGASALCAILLIIVPYLIKILIYKVCRPIRQLKTNMDEVLTV